MVQKNKKSQKNANEIAAKDPALVNSSYTVFFVLTAIAWAKILSTYFPAKVQSQAFVISLLFTVLLFVFRYFIMQFQSTTTILNMVVLYFSLSAVMTVASAVKGPLADGTIPAIQFTVLGSHFFTSATPVYIVASVFTFYGVVTLICTEITAAILEGFYNLCNGLLPKGLRRKLLAVDARIDAFSLRESWELFYDHAWLGVIAGVAILGVYAVAYFMSLIV